VYSHDKTQLQRKGKEASLPQIGQRDSKNNTEETQVLAEIMETKSSARYEEYCSIRNKVKGLVRAAKYNMEKEIASDAKGNPKRFWKYVNSKRKTKSGICELSTEVNGETITARTDREKADMLADFFSSVFTHEPQGDIPLLPDATFQHMFVDREFTENEVCQLMQDLDTSKSPGPDEVHPRELKELSSTISKPLTRIFNASLKYGKVPKTWKKGNITALFKKGDKQQPGNYRPVSLTCILCKLLEKLIRKEIMAHMNINNLLSDKQFGFLAGRSTTLQLLKVMDEWTDILDRGDFVDVIYLDFMKAFDTVPHKRLINKCLSYGLSKQIVTWVENFLSNRVQSVVVNGVASEQQPVTSGIPQGSVLGPVLFVIYINDLPDCVTSRCYLFADDTKLYRQISNPDGDVASLQTDLDNLGDWSNTWLLKFHPQKCKSLSICNKRQNTQDTAYHLYNPQGDRVGVEKSSSEKDIGVTVDNHLEFNKHIQLQVNKANSIVGLIKRSFTFLDNRSFKLLFQALVRPHLEYAAAVWNPHLCKYIDLLENVQRRATKLLKGLKDLSYSERLRVLKLPTLRYRRLRGDMIEVYKIVHNIYDSRVSCNILSLSHSITRGNSYKLVKQTVRLDVRKYSFACRVVDIWNGLPEHVVSAPSIHAFENRLDKIWKDIDVLYDYKAEFQGVRVRTEDYSSESETDEDVDIEAEMPASIKKS
jgi:hypothetical protein